MSAISTYDFLDPPTQTGDIGVLGHYRVISELGRGGMGFVFRAEDMKLKRTVALKVMNQKISTVPNSRKRFLSEARAMAAVHHDHVVTIFEVGESKGTPFMAMEMLSGETLETFNKSNPNLGFEKIIDFASQISRGLAAAHAKGIVHRDIKPANIWIQEGTERVKILDFGLALASSPVDHLAGRGAVIGTPGYLSPEQARSDAMDDRSDLYSLGVVLYEMCTGKLPIQAKSVPGQLISILAHRPQPIGELNPEIPRPLCDLVHKLLRKEPRSRVASAVKLQEDLERVHTECQKSTEVALAINRLKEGLSEVVTKKSPTSAFDGIEEIEAIHDPLAGNDSILNLPAIPVTMAASQGISNAIPRARASVQKNDSQNPAWKVYLPLVAIVSLVLVALPILTFAFTNAGRSNEAFVITPLPNTTSQVQQPAQSNPQPRVAQSQEPQNGSPTLPDTTPQRPNEQEQRKAPIDNGNSGLQNEQNNSNSDQVNRQTTPPKTNDRQPKMERPESSDASTEETIEPSSKQAESNNSSNDSSRTIPTPKEVVPPSVPMHWIPISTNDGRGADTVVRNGGGGDNLGIKPSIGIQTRGGIEVVHSYIRFDLAEIKDKRELVNDAGLILTVVGSMRPVGATIRVYGIDEVANWSESKLEWDQTPSSEKAPKKLDQYEILAEITVTADTDEHSDGKNQIRISDPRIAEFIKHSDDLVTFALAGKHDNAQLRFVSREKSPGEAPQLLVEVPLNVSNPKN